MPNHTWHIKMGLETTRGTSISRYGPHFSLWAPPARASYADAAIRSLSSGRPAGGPAHRTRGVGPPSVGSPCRVRNPIFPTDAFCRSSTATPEPPFVINPKLCAVPRVGALPTRGT